MNRSTTLWVSLVPAIVLGCARPAAESSAARPPSRPAVVVGEQRPAPSAEPARTDTVAGPGLHPTPGGWSLQEALCGADTACGIDSMEPLPWRDPRGQPHLVRTSVTKEAAEERGGFGAGYPDHWIVVLDETESVREAQRLAVGFKQGEQPKSDELWSTFTFETADARGRLNVDEPSPGGTAWGRSGSVEFAWPGFVPLVWEHTSFHVINPKFNTTLRWSWDTRSGSADYTGISFRYSLPRLTLDEGFTAEAWTDAAFDRCSSRLDSKNAERLRGSTLAPHALDAVLSARGELFVELRPAERASPSARARLEVCFAADVLHNEPDAPGLPPPPCVSWSLDGATVSTAARVEKAPDKLRYKVTFAMKPLEEPSGVTLVFRDGERRQALLSSAYDFRSYRRLGHVLTFSSERVTCDLRADALVPRFGALDPQVPLIEQLW